MESKKPLKRLRRKQNQVLAKLSEMSRRDLNKLQRLKTNALITIEIHSRDVIDRLYKASELHLLFIFSFQPIVEKKLPNKIYFSPMPVMLTNKTVSQKSQEIAQ